MKTALLSLAILLSLPMLSNAQAQQIDLHFDGKRTLVTTGNTLLEAGKKSFSTLKEFDREVKASLLDGKEIWVGSDKGIDVYELASMERLRTIFRDTAIADIERDANGKIWVATTFKGVYKQSGKGFEPKLSVMANYCLAPTPDGNMYVGTNIGLYQIPLKENAKTIRYAEEAHSGHGLPDNIVEHLYADQASNLWIMMPDNVSFKKSDNSFGEIPTFAFVGNKENRISTIVGLSGDNFLFVTTDGVLLLPSASLQPHGHGDEVFSGHDSHALLLDAEMLDTPKHLSRLPVRYAEKHDGKIYFYTTAGVWKMKEKDIIRILRKKAEKKETGVTVK